MSHRHSRSVRLAADALEARDVPSATVVESYRPLIFTIQGTVSTEETKSATTGDSTESETQTTTETYDGTFTATGSVDYTSPTSGTSGTVSVVGSGRGVTPEGSYTNTFNGALTFADDNGAWTTVEPYTGSETWTSGRGSATEPTGPITGSGTFDVSKYTFTSNWDNTEDGVTKRGEVRATVSQIGIAPTDLAITSATGTAGDNRTLNVALTAEASGQLMKATGETAAATHLTATWESDTRSEEADVRIPISWNAGVITADITGLQPPEWATRLVLQIDGANKIPEANENNNRWVVELAGLIPTEPVAPPPAPPQVPSNFAIAPDGTNHILWLTASGEVMFRVPSFEPEFTGPVNLAAGDVNGDGVVDAVVSAGVGGGPHVKVFDGATGRQLAGFMAYETAFTGGVTIAVGDVNGDRKAEVITGTGDGGAPRVRVLDIANGGVVRDYFAFGEDLRGGVSVAVVDQNGDGRAEVVAGSGKGDEPKIRIFDGNTGAALGSYFVANPATREGVTLGVGRTPSGQLWLAVDTRGVEGVKHFRLGNTSGGESALEPLPLDNWIDVLG